MSEYKIPKQEQHDPVEDIKGLIDFNNKVQDNDSNFRDDFSMDNISESKLKDIKSNLIVDLWKLEKKHEDSLARVGFVFELSKDVDEPEEAKLILQNIKKFSDTLSLIPAGALSEEEARSLVSIVTSCVDEQIIKLLYEKNENTENFFKELAKESTKIFNALKEISVAQPNLIKISGIGVFLKYYEHATKSGFLQDFIKIYKAELFEVENPGADKIINSYSTNFCSSKTGEEMTDLEDIKKVIKVFHTKLSLSLGALEGIDKKYRLEDTVELAFDNCYKMLRFFVLRMQLIDKGNTELRSRYKEILLFGAKKFLSKISEFVVSGEMDYVDIKEELDSMVKKLEGKK
ncbi:hypothetical protein A2914_02545 [Candidatus Nomurabacteria bacterium RIFCSPLOWO2_01_FULL_41_21]|uniref:Uncharacterized protein n=2 Tax=Candidatus Nomuraibacteriota TaxID=1752729 RepID=A0A1F6V2Z6_9BACT|nr:MAG: hypothetical protein A2733_02560 [Candidatus Nomurabacteria bacterium RIFCSPHIGHO2_01_FULL_40_20]OGI88844.1 MAG: hypothetical protein A2914_02545 [Candidatus Nomurabacteria bacterium RIFCSPLOWO2_01_FULL_41_21]